MKKKNIAWGLFFIFLAAVYLVISSTGMELGVGLPGIFMTVLFVWLFVEGIKDVNFYSIVFAKIKIDPAVASGPLITTVNDLVAVVTYYGLAWLFLIPIMN